MDTIYALASARGKSGVSVVRISGPRAFDALMVLAGAVPPPRRASLRVLRYKGEALDEALVIAFLSGASFTGEDSVELHLHGASAVVAAVLDALGDQPGLRPAEAGEFTRRALENGCLDLAQVEGLSDLIEAETEAQRKQALRVLSGAVGRRSEGWRQKLIRASALLEATIDFADEDVPLDVAPEVMDLVTRVQDELRREMLGFGAAERIREGFEVAIVGRPNAGKSTLLNYLAGREAAITSEVAGTTRDVIEVRMDLSGLAVTLLDTAGLRETDDAVESIGVNRAMERAETADLRIFLLDDKEIPLIEPKRDDVLAFGKSDVVDGRCEGLAVSGKTGDGVSDLVSVVTERLLSRTESAGVITRTRHKFAIQTALEAMESAIDEIKSGSDRPELAAEYLRRAVRGLDSLVGRVDVEHLLDEIFSSFCIGK